MVEIPDRLKCLFSGSVEETEGSYSIEIPPEELDMGEVSAGETYRVVILEKTESTESDEQNRDRSSNTRDSMSEPPVAEGEIREVTIDSLGDQGDGIAKVERGYVLIVPGARPEDEVTVEITDVRENFAFTDVRDAADSPVDR